MVKSAKNKTAKRYRKKAQRGGNNLHSISGSTLEGNTGMASAHQQGMTPQHHQQGMATAHQAQHGGSGDPQSQHMGQSGGVPPVTGAGAAASPIHIDQSTIESATQAAKGILGQFMNNSGGSGGDVKQAAMVGGAALTAAGLSTDPIGSISNALSGSSGPQAHEGYSSLSGTPLSGGRRRRRRGALSKKQKLLLKEEEKLKSQSGGMLPGLMTAVETALVPLGLYVGQKALQARSGRGSGRVFSPYDQLRNKFSRGTRRRRSGRR